MNLCMDPSELKKLLAENHKEALATTLPSSKKWVARDGIFAAKSFETHDGGEGDKGDEQNLEIREGQCYRGMERKCRHVQLT